MRLCERRGLFEYSSNVLHLESSINLTELNIRPVNFRLCLFSVATHPISMFFLFKKHLTRQIAFNITMYTCHLPRAQHTNPAQAVRRVSTPCQLASSAVDETVNCRPKSANWVDFLRFVCLPLYRGLPPFTAVFPFTTLSVRHPRVQLFTDWLGGPTL